MKIKFILLVIAYFSLPVMGYAEVFKCKSADGKISYSDQECPGSAAVPAASRSASASMTIPSQKREEHTANTSQKNESKQPTYFPRSSYEPDPPMSQKEKDKWRELAKEMDKKIDSYIAERTQRCKRGNAKACEEGACNSMERGLGPAEDFLYCAKAKGLTYGSYWVLTSGKPDADPQNDKNLLEAALTPRLPAGRHAGSSSRMNLLCFRKNKLRTDALADQYRLQQILYVAKGANRPLLTHAFAQDGYGNYGTKTMPEYKTLEELVDKTCEK